MGEEDPYYDIQNEEFDDDYPMIGYRRKPHCCEVFSLELQPGRDCMVMWIWKILFLLVDVANITVVILIAMEAKDRVDDQEDYHQLVITLSVLVCYMVLLELFTLFGVAKWITMRFSAELKCIPMSILLIFLVGVPILMLTGICYEIIIILDAEGVLMDYYYEVDYGARGYWLGFFYCLFFLFYPTAVIRPGRYTAFYGMNICCGFKKDRDVGEYGMGLMVAGDGDAAACGCKVSKFSWPNVLYLINMVFRLVILSLGLSLYHYVKHYTV